VVAKTAKREMQIEWITDGASSCLWLDGLIT
jgi:hypothetical protein